ncbi:MAG: DNA topoisomerase I [Thermoplasmata archaeon]
MAEKADAGRRIAYFLSDGKQKAKRAKGLNYIEFRKGDDDYALVSLSGHVVELDFPKEMNDWSSVDLNKLIFAEINKNLKNKTVGNTLLEFGSRESEFIIATDYDREGELIGTEALELAGFRRDPQSNRIRRAKFSTLTREEIESAFANLIDVDYDLADSAGAREEVDLIWGAVLTRFFSVSTKRLGKDFLSVGRVQTPTLALIVERENEITAFKQETFWKIIITFNKGGHFQGIYEKTQLFDKKEADAVFSAVNGQPGLTKSFEKSVQRIPKPPPFNTTEFLREASRIGVNPARAMSIAESLYVKGYISYPRTDNTVYQRSISLSGVLKKLQKGEFKDDVEKVLAQDSIRPSRGRTEATDHPPIYPVAVPKGADLKGDFHKIYELIVRRFLATLYRDGQREVRKATIQVAGYNFISEGSKIIDEGWLSLYPYRKVSESYHPDLVEGEEVKAIKWEMQEDHTKPPPRYDAASLLKLMESLRLGTKSTRHEIIQKLQDRGFIQGNPVRPTHLGIGFIQAIKLINSPISKPEMTAKLEEDMDRITKKEISKQAVVNESREMLSNVLKDFITNKQRIVEVINSSARKGDTVGTCPEHHTDLIILKSRDSAKIKCTTEGCKIDFYVPVNALIKVEEKNCPDCSLPLIRIIRKGQAPETRCMNPSCTYNKKNASLGACPVDGGDLVIRQSRSGKRFLACTNYPKCTQTYPLPQMGFISPTGEKCPFCGAPLLVSARKGYRWKFCPKIDCDYNKKKNEARKEEKVKS